MNVSGLLSLFDQLPAYGELVTELKGRQRRVPPLGLLRSARPALLAALARDLDRPLLIVVGQVERAGKIIDHLRTFGRPRTQQLSSVKLCMPVDGVMVFLREQLHRRGIKVAIDVPADLPPVAADRFGAGPVAELAQFAPDADAPPAGVLQSEAVNQHPHLGREAGTARPGATKRLEFGHSFRHAGPAGE